MGRVLLSERTDELSSLYIENKEAVFFSSVEEMMEKIEWLLKNPDICHNIGKAGMKKSWDAGFDIHSRTKIFLGQIH
jgi:spore maturation protein CgeB